MVSFENKDDVETVLIHLGYLAYDRAKRKAFIPNEEIRSEFIKAVGRRKWDELIELQVKSQELLHATLDMDGDAVADAIAEIHMDFAPALLIELKWNQSANAAIQQIKERKYTKALEGYTGDMLLVGINYRKKDSRHQCVIEKFKKQIFP